jgi:hypothetical protein
MKIFDARMRAPNNIVEKRNRRENRRVKLKLNNSLSLLTKGRRSIEYAPRSDERIVL